MSFNFNIEPLQASQIKLGHFIMINERPCKIVECNHASTGKHGHTKVALVGIDILTNKKLSFLCHGESILSKFKPLKFEYQLLDIRSEQVSNDVKNVNITTLECLTVDNKEITLDLRADGHTDDSMIDRIKKEYKRSTTIDKTLLIHVLFGPVQKQQTSDSEAHEEFIVTGYQLDP